MLELLLGFDAQTFARGRLELAWSWAGYGSGVAGIALLVALGLGYARLGPPGRGATLRRTGLGVARVALLSVLLFALLSPTLVVSLDEPVRGRVVVLVDDSRSMAIDDHEDGSARRSDFVQRMLAPGAGGIATALEARFETGYFAFARALSPIETVLDLSFSHPRSDLAGALQAALATPGEAPLAAIVVVTDGAHNGAGSLPDALLALRAAGVPVHAIGVGAERLPIDVEIAAISVPEEVLRGDVAQASVTVMHQGLGGTTVEIEVEDESGVIDVVPLTLSQERTRVTIPIRAAELGTQRLHFRIAPQPGETVLENNESAAAITFEEARVPVLHFEGEPRFEVKFLRRAVADDEGLRLVSVVRTAENKYYRLGVEGPEELASGFPVAEEALFRFRVLVLGSLEAASFTEEQIAMVTDFVERRGGGLLLLGGRRALAEGGYRDTPLAGLLPVHLDPPSPGFQAAVRPVPTAAARRHPVTRGAREDRLGGRVDASAGAQPAQPAQPAPPSSAASGSSGVETGPATATPTTPWHRLPRLTVVNPVRRAKPGASVLLEGDDGSGEPLVLLAHHRYGRGTVAVLAARDTWRWQMHPDIEVEDQTHEVLWRRLVRWLARPARGRVEVIMSPRSAVPGEPVTVDATVRDASFRPDPGADVQLSVIDPLGERRLVAMERQPIGDGSFRARFTPTEPGPHEVRLVVRGTDAGGGAGRDGDEVAAIERLVDVTSTGRELHRAGLAVGTLTRVAEETGGRFYRAEQAHELIDAIVPVDAARTVLRRLSLLESPGLYLLILLLAALEWIQRRRWRLT